jgi:hypothetical protein
LAIVNGSWHERRTVVKKQKAKNIQVGGLGEEAWLGPVRAEGRADLQLER